MRHSDHDLVCAGLRGELERLVEHRHEDVEPFDRELLLPEERAAQVVLEPLDLGQPLEQPLSLSPPSAAAGTVRTRSPAAARRAPGGRRCARSRRRSSRSRSPVASEDVRQRFALDPHAEHGGRDAALAARASAWGRATRARGQGRRRAPSREDRAGPRDGRGSGGPSRRASRPQRRRGALSGRARRGRRQRASGGGVGSGAGGRVARASTACAVVCLRGVSRSRARPGSDSASSGSPLSNTARHSAGTASGFSRYSSRRPGRSRRSARRRRARSSGSLYQRKPLLEERPPVNTATSSRPARRERRLRPRRRPDARGARW